MIVGRVAELASIGQALDEACRGQARTVRLGGSPGVGTSTLLGAARQLAAERSMLVLATQGRAADTDMVFAGLGSLLRPLADRLDQIAADDAAIVRMALDYRTRQLDPVDIRLAVFRTITGLAESQPVALCIDDAHLLDAATADAVEFVAARASADAVAVVLGGHESSATLHVGALSVDELVTILHGSTAIGGEVARRCAELADGSPATAVQLAASLSDGQRRGLEPFPAVPSASVAVVGALQARLDQLSEAGRRALVVIAAALAHTDIDYDALVGALDALGESDAGLAEAEQAGLFQVIDGTVHLSHPLLQPLAYGQVAIASRRAAHRAVASVLVRPDQAAARAIQLAAGAHGPDEDIAAALELVAEQSARRAGAASAARTMSRAAAMSPDRGDALVRESRAASWWLLADPQRAASRAADILADELVTRTAVDIDAMVNIIATVDGPRAALQRAPADGVGDELHGRLTAACAAFDDGPDPAIVQLGGGVGPLAVLDNARRLAASGRAAEARGLVARVRLEPVASTPLFAVWLDTVEADVLTAGRTSSSALDLDAWIGRLGESVAVLEPAGWAAASTVAHCVLGRLLLSAGRTDEALASLRAAHERRPQWAADDLAGAHRAPKPSSAAVTADASQPDVLAQLTVAEQRVATAVADGLTNKEAAAALFLSVKTVDFHLQGIYRKLGVRSRTELAVRLSNRGT
jgi:DNA-binding CsgD family transcriptional regulator